MDGGGARKKLMGWMGRNDLSAYRLAKLLQISRSGLSRLLHDGALPTLPVAAKIEAATDGEVRAQDWITPNQRRAADRAKARVWTDGMDRAAASAA